MNAMRTTAVDEVFPVLVTLAEPRVEGGGPRAAARRTPLPPGARVVVPHKARAPERIAAQPLPAGTLARMLSNFRVPEEGRNQAISRQRGTRAAAPVRYFPHLGMLLGTTDTRGRGRLAADPDVVAVAPLPPITSIPSVGPARRLEEPTALVTWGIRSLQIERLWRQGLSGAGVLVGHLDTGIDGRHPAFAPDAIASFTFFDFAGDERPATTIAYDTGRHGTHTAGTIVGRPVDGRAVGIAPGAALASAIVIEGGDIARRVIAGIDWALGSGVRIINLSLGVFGRDPGWGNVVARVRSRGVLPVVAIGNEGPGTSRSPGNDPLALSVGAVGRDGSVAAFSSSQWFPGQAMDQVPDLVAPGVEVQSAEAGGRWLVQAGTSQAVPHISGLAALLWEARPDATIDEIEQAILGSCSQVGPDPRRGGRGVPDGPLALASLTGTPVAAAARRRSRATPPPPRSRRRSRRGGAPRRRKR